MKLSKILAGLFCLTALFCLTMTVSAEDAAAQKIRVLVFYGGHPFNMDDFKKNFDGADNMEISYAKLPEGRDLLAPGLEKSYDVLVMFDMDQTPATPKQQQNLKDLLSCGIGYFSFHHNLCALYDWDDYYDICGGKTMLTYAYPGQDKAMFRGQPYEFSTFTMSMVEIEVADKDHPITKGVKNFALEEEAYGKALVNPDVHVLLSSKSPTMCPQVAWTWHYNNSPVFGIFLGHDIHMWTNPEFHKVFIQAIEWLNDETQKERAALAK